MKTGNLIAKLPRSLGSPKEIAEELLTNYVPEKAEIDNKMIKITDNTFTKVAMNIKYRFFKCLSIRDRGHHNRASKCT